MKKVKLAVIGAGMSGLTFARELEKSNPHQCEILLFEKYKEVGGRMATKYDGEYNFDHGTQFVSPHDKDFSNFLENLEKFGVVKRWDARFMEVSDRKVTVIRTWDRFCKHYVGYPDMNAIPKYLSQGLNVKKLTKVLDVRKSDSGGWNLYGENINQNKGKSKDNANNQGDVIGDSKNKNHSKNTGNVFLGEFDWVIFTLPAEQTINILPSEFQYRERISNFKMSGCFTLLLGFPEPLPIPFDAALIKGEDISWISVNNSKVNQSKNYTLVIDSKNKWADAHINDDVEDVEKHLFEQVSQILDMDLSHAEYKSLKTWRYANIAKQSGDYAMLDASSNLGICGDYFIQGRVESAFLSGKYLANQFSKILDLKYA